MADPSAINSEPTGGFSFKQMLPTLVFDVAMPIIAFNVLTRYGVSTLWALVAGGLFPASNNLRVWTKIVKPTSHDYPRPRHPSLLHSRPACKEGSSIDPTRWFHVCRRRHGIPDRGSPARALPAHHAHPRSADDARARRGADLAHRARHGGARPAAGRGRRSSRNK